MTQDNYRMREVADDAQRRAWEQLSSGIDRSIDGIWSMAADSAIAWIYFCQNATGTWTAPDQIPFGPVLTDGIYTAITGIEVSDAILSACRRHADHFGIPPTRQNVREGRLAALAEAVVLAQELV